MFHRLNPAWLKSSSRSLIFLSNYHGLPTILTIFLFSPFKISLYFLLFKLFCLVVLHLSPPSLTLSCSQLHFPKATIVVLFLSFFVCVIDPLHSYNKNNDLQSFDLCVIRNLERTPSRLRKKSLLFGTTAQREKFHFCFSRVFCYY